MWTSEADVGQAIRSGGDRGKLRTQTLPKAAAMAELQAFISRGEHWPRVARSSEFIKSNNRMPSFINEMSAFLKTSWTSKICLQQLKTLGLKS